MTESSDALAHLPATPRLPSSRVSRYTDNAKAANTRKAYRIDREMDRHGTLGTARLDAGSVGRIVKRACALASLDTARYSGHSLRSGMATSAAAGAAPERAILRQGCWRNRAIVDHHVRHSRLWQECAAAFMGLEARPW